MQEKGKFRLWLSLNRYPDEGAAFGRWDAAAGPDRWTEAAALRNLISHIRPGSNMVSQMRQLTQS